MKLFVLVPLKNEYLVTVPLYKFMLPHMLLRITGGKTNGLTVKKGFPPKAGSLKSKSSKPSPMLTEKKKMVQITNRSERPSLLIPQTLKG